MRFLFLVAKKTKPVKNGIQHLILDDTLLPKCGKVMEAVGRLWDHVVHLIGMMKMGNAKYNCQGVELNSGELLQRLCKKSKRCRKLKSNYIHIEVIYKGFPVKLFFSRFGKRAKWHLILTTDLSLDYLTMMKHYQVRWTIEVYFKESKQLLNLGACRT